MNSSKASVQITMSWIFMIVIGTFFILLAYNIIGKYQDIEEEKYNLELKQTLRNILNNVGRTTGIEENSLEPLGNIFKNKEVEIICVDNIPILSLDNNLDSNNEFLKNYPIFMTKIEEGTITNTYLGVESYKFPFKVSNVLAIISKKNLIVFDENSAITEDFIYKFRRGSYDNLNYISRDFTSLNFENFKQEFKKSSLSSVIFVSDYGKKLSDLSFLSDLGYDSYMVEFEQSNSKSGILTYYDNQGSVYSYNYIDIDDSMTLQSMAIFSSPETFSCSYSLLFNKMESVYDFYLNKTSYFINQSSSLQLCSESLEDFEQPRKYENIFTSLTKLKESLINDNFNDLSTSETLVSNVEKDLKVLEDFNCPYVY